MSFPCAIINQPATEVAKIKTLAHEPVYQEANEASVSCSDTKNV